MGKAAPFSGIAFLKNLFKIKMFVFVKRSQSLSVPNPQGYPARGIRKDFKLVKNQGNSLNQGNFPYPCLPLITLVGGRATARTAIGSERKRKTAKDRKAVQREVSGSGGS
jgi:hypothetical protein